MKKTILITGGNGFVGSALARELRRDHSVVAVDLQIPDISGVECQGADLCHAGDLTGLFQSRTIDRVIHCAGIAHQKVGRISQDDYFRVNSQATRDLAATALDHNPDIGFLFLSSVSVYGENFTAAVDENHACHPSSDYARSKLAAEQHLGSLYREKGLSHVDILRLAPVYDTDFRLNLDRRILAPGKIAYLRFGRGNQTLSALARPNLVGFIRHLLEAPVVDTLRYFNVCDPLPYSFNTLIRTYKTAGIHGFRPTLTIPLSGVKLGTRLAARLFPRQRSWWYACYDKLNRDLIFDPKAMLNTGYHPHTTLEAVLTPHL